MLGKVWDEITFPSINYGATVEIGMDKQFHPTLYNGHNYLSVVGLKLNHVSKRGPWRHVRNCEVIGSLESWFHRRWNGSLERIWYCAAAHLIIPRFINTLRPRQNGHHFADDTFKHIFMNENVRISINISLKLVPKGLITNSPSLV